MRIINVAGARPNFMKIAPLMREMQRVVELEPILVHTGQHYDERMSAIFFDQLGIPKPDHNLGVGSGSYTQQTAQVMLALEPLFLEIKPDLVLVVGDVNSTLAAALVAVKLHIPLAHVEAGLRSFDRSMPEEINRILVDGVADYLFTTERGAGENLQREGVPVESIFFVGNLMIDTLLAHRGRAEALRMPEQLGLKRGKYAVVTLHRPSNVDNPAVFADILDALAEIQLALPIIFPIHPRTRKRLSEMGLHGRIGALPGLRLVDPLGYLEFLGLMASAGLVLTDSGGIQEETTILSVPCLTLRENTERPVTLSQGTNELVGVDAERIKAAARRALCQHGSVLTVPELRDGHAGERIVRILRDKLREGERARLG